MVDRQYTTNGYGEDLMGNKKHIKCWLCNEWTPEHLTRKIQFNDTVQPVCIECYIEQKQRSDELKEQLLQLQVTEKAEREHAKNLKET